MAEAFARIIGRDRVESWSAGSRPSGGINPKAAKSMKRVGYDLSAHRSKSVSELPTQEYDAVITMGCGDACPFVPAILREDWQIPDPRNLGSEEFDRVRDLIRSKVKELLARL